MPATLRRLRDICAQARAGWVGSREMGNNALAKKAVRALTAGMIKILGGQRKLSGF